jgi:perosamine synthetase
MDEFASGSGQGTLAELPRVSSSTEFLRAIREVVGDGAMSLHEPVIGDLERQLVDECLASGYVSSIGSFVVEFERALTEVTGANYAIAVSSGTAALHLSLLLVGVLPGDEVLVPSATFVATANAVTYCGATPHFVDVEWETLGMDPNALIDWLTQVAILSAAGPINRLTGNRIAACVPMHTFGHPVDVQRVRQALDQWGIPMVEDAAEALGSFRAQQHCGTFGQVGTLSFNGNKVVTTGGGGALITDDEELASRARHLSTTAKVAHRWEFIHDQIGFNYRMPNLNASLGCAQLTRLDAMVASKRRLAEAYQEQLGRFNFGQIFVEPSDCRSNYWLQTYVLAEGHEHLRESILNEAVATGLHLRPLWRPLHLLAPYASAPAASLPITEQLAQRVINLPSSAFFV